MDDYQKVLKRAGIALIIISMLDVLYMAYAVMSGESYSASVNILAVIAGVLLVRGSLRPVRIVTWFCAFILVCFGGVACVILPMMQPFDLFLTNLKLNPIQVVVKFLIMIGTYAIVVWCYRQLRSPVVQEALKQSGRKHGAPKTAFALGAIVFIALATMMFTVFKHPMERAEAIAKQQMGSNYKYATESIQWSGKQGRATVAAYNNDEIKKVEVKWNDEAE